MFYRVIISFVVILFASVTNAGIYTCKDQDGNTIYSDNPNAENCVNAEKVNVDSLPPLIKTKPLVYPSATSNTNVGNAADLAYSSIEITSPAAEESIRSNIGDVNINYQSTPPLQLQAGHQYVVTMGGEEVYTGTNNNIALKGINRGTHTLSAKIISAEGKTLIDSPSIQFTLHRYSSLQGGSPAPAPTPSPNPVNPGPNGGGNTGGGIGGRSGS